MLNTLCQYTVTSNNYTSSVNSVFYHLHFLEEAAKFSDVSEIPTLTSRARAACKFLVCSGLLWFCFVFVSFLFLRQGFIYVTQADLELVALPPQPSKC